MARRTSQSKLKLSLLRLPFPCKPTNLGPICGAHLRGEKVTVFSVGVSKRGQATSFLECCQLALQWDGGSCGRESRRVGCGWGRTGAPAESRRGHSAGRGC